MPKRIEMLRDKPRKFDTVEKEDVTDIIGKIGNVTLNRISRNWMKSGEMDIEILTDSRSKNFYDIIGTIDLSKKNILGKTFYHVDYAKAHIKFAGFRLLPTVYHYLITKKGLNLQAGSLQSVGGRNIWNTLGGMKGIILYAVRGDDMIELTKGDEGELVGKDDEDYSPYDLSSTKIVAMKR